MDRNAYDRHLELEEHHFWRIAKRRLVHTLIAQEFGARTDLRIVDIGSASSLLPRELLRFGSAVCVEPDRDVAEVARTRLNLTVYHGALPDQLPEGLGPTDLVTMLDVLEHIEDDVGALRAVRELLRPNGLLVLTVPALRWLWSDHDVVLHHKRRYHRDELIDVLQRAGFEVTRVSYYTSLLLPLLAGQRLASRLRPKKGPPVYDVRVPNRLVNRALGQVMSFERQLLSRHDLPIGSALFAVARPT